MNRSYKDSKKKIEKINRNSKELNKKYKSNKRYRILLIKSKNKNRKRRIKKKNKGKQLLKNNSRLLSSLKNYLMINFNLNNMINSILTLY